MSAMGKAIGYFQQAIDLDPNYALAYAGLGDAVAQPSDVVPHLARREKARAAIDRALALDPDLAEAHTAMAHVLIRYDIDFAGGERELRRSLELDPKWIDTYQRMGELYTFQGRFDEAFSWYRKGMDLEPFNVPLNTAYASALFCRRQYDAALEQLRKIEEMDPNHRNAQLLFYQVYTAKGMYADAVEHHVRELQINNDPRGEQLKRAFQKNGWEGFLRAELERFSTFNTSPYFLPHFGEANIYAQLGDKENAFAELEKSYEGYEQPSLVVIKVYPGMDPLRDDPRFKELLRKLGLPE
jgi:tetratricopeptide (TPR) repeat protein